MGSSTSRPRYPFPMPDNDPHRSKSNKFWSLSSRKKSKHDREHDKYDDFIPKFPTPAAATFAGFPYYPQMPAYPAYYAPVPMAVVQPFGGVQQPVFAMPQAYLPTAYNQTTAPVQPALARAPPIQPAPTTVQMPAPAPAPTVPMPAPAPAPAPAAPTQMPVAPFPTALTQVPEPHPIYDPVIPNRVIPPSPFPADPVIPPPPILTSEPPRAPDSTRPRFTDFYRPADFPGPPPPRMPTTDEPGPMPMPMPGRAPTAGPSRTPFALPPPPIQMPMPSPRPTVPVPTRNPLPAPPADVWDSSPYRQVLQSLPNELPPLFDLHPCPDALIGFPEPEPDPRSSSRLGGLFGTSRKDKGKNPLRGLFGSRRTGGYDTQSDAGSSNGSRRGHRHGHNHSRSQTMTTILVPPPPDSSSASDIPPTLPTTSMPVPSHGPPIRFDHTGDYAGFVNHSNHRVMYKNATYPTALHLLEAMKFAHQPALQERIRSCKDVNDMYPLSASLQEHVRPDWGQVFLQTMEDVLYLKFKQHSALRTLLLRTGLADIIYADDNDYWGEGPSGDGVNELGKAIMRVRERLRREGER